MKDFAYHERILLGAVDEYGCLLVKEIMLAPSQVAHDIL